MEDPDLTFLTMTCCYARSVRQWEAIPDEEVAPYNPPGEENSSLKIADSTKSILGCRYPIRSIVIRDDIPNSSGGCCIPTIWRALLRIWTKSTAPDSIMKMPLVRSNMP